MFCENIKKKNVDLSIIIVNWNAKDLLMQCLDSIYKIEWKINVEVIVVDNGSIDESVKMCGKKFPKARIIKNKINLGYGYANNIGVSECKSECILLLNSDTILKQGSIEKLHSLMDNDSKIGVIGCRLISPDGSYQVSYALFPNIRRMLTERLLLYFVSKKFPRCAIEPPFIDISKECDWIVGACMLIRKKAFIEAGLFDPNIFMYGEEMDLCYRIKEMGWKIVFEPDAKIIHLIGGSWKNNAYSPTFLKVNGYLLFFKKHFSISNYLIVYFLCLFGAFLRIIMWSILYIAQRGKNDNAFFEIKTNFKLLLKLSKISSIHHKLKDLAKISKNHIGRRII